MNFGMNVEPLETTQILSPWIPYHL